MFWRRGNKDKAKSFKSSFVRAACRLGFLSDEQAVKADALIEADPSAPSQDLIIQAGLMTKEEAERVDAERKTSDAPGLVDDLTKRAHAALEDTHDSATRLLNTITQPISVSDIAAAKKKIG